MIRKRDLKQKSKTGNQKKEKLFQEKNTIEYFDVFLFMKQKQWRKIRKERDKNKKLKESKKERQEGR